MATNTRYYAGGLIANAPAKNKAEEYDGPTATFTRWDPAGVVLEQRALTPAESADLAAIDAANTATANAETLRTRAQAALSANQTFLVLPSPTNAQILAQVQRLTKECNALIRLALDLTSDISDTV